MTSPSKPNPPLDTANVGSLRAFAGKSEEQWKKELKEDVDRKYRGIGATFKEKRVYGLYGLARLYEGLTGKNADLDVVKGLADFFKEVGARAWRQRAQIADLQANPTLTWISTQVEDMVTFPASWMMDEVLSYTPERTATRTETYQEPQWDSQGNITWVTKTRQVEYVAEGERFKVGTYHRRMTTGGLVLCPLSVDRQARLFRLKFAGTGPKEQELERDTLNACIFALDSDKDTLKLVWDSGNIVTSLAPSLRAYNVPVLLDDRSLQPGQLLFVGLMQRNMEVVPVKAFGLTVGTKVSDDDADWMRMAGIRQIGAANGSAGIVPSGNSFLKGTCFVARQAYSAIPQTLSLSRDLLVQTDWMPWLALQTKPPIRPNPMGDESTWGGVTTEGAEGGVAR